MRLQRSGGTPSLQLRSLGPAPAAGTQPARSNHAARAPLSSPPAAHRPRGQTQRGRDKEPHGRPVPKSGPCGRPAAAARVRRGGGARRRGVAAGRRISTSGSGGQAGTSPAPRSSGAFSPFTLSVGFSSPSPPPTGSGAAQRKPIRERQLRPVPVKHPLGWDGERTRLGMRNEVGFQLVENLLFSQLTLRFRSASRLGRALPPPPSPESTGPRRAAL